MKWTRILVIVSLAVLSLVLTDWLYGQPPQREANQLELEIRKIDAAEKAAVLARDVATIQRMWAEDIVVNAPNNQVVTGREDVIKWINEGLIDYASFERVVEMVAVHGDTAIVMGEETVTPQGNAPFAGQTVRRRFTNIWMKRDGPWHLTARQATIISQQ